MQTLVIAASMFLVPMLLAVVITALISACLTPFSVFVWGGGVDKFRQHLHRCVVEENCPRGDDVIHRYIEKRVWMLDQRFGLIGLVPATFVWGWIDLLTQLLQPFKQLWREVIAPR